MKQATTILRGALLRFAQWRSGFILGWDIQQRRHSNERHFGRPTLRTDIPGSSQHPHSHRFVYITNHSEALAS